MNRRVTCYEYTCLRCGQKWLSRTKHPKYCGKCKSPYWNRPYKLTKYLSKNQ